MTSERSKHRVARPCAIFCTGMPRSGSTWSYNVARQLLSHAFGVQQIDGGYLGEGPPADAALEQRLLPKKLRLAKFHQATRHTHELAEQGQASVIVPLPSPLALTRHAPLGCCRTIADNSLEAVIQMLAPPDYTKRGG